MQGTGVFICSSDNRRDVLDRVVPSVSRYWPDCPYPIYVGLNAGHGGLQGIVPVLAPVSDWRRELTIQLRQVPERRLIVLLDDYLIQAPVVQRRVEELLETFEKSRLSYLRLSPLGRSVVERLLVREGDSPGDIRLISETRPYHSSLRIAIWCKEHLLAMLAGSGSIWDFEHQRRDGVRHFAVANRQPIRYQHLVEKGWWQPYARRLLRKAGLSDDLGSRPVWAGWTYARVWLDQLRFFFSGIANH